MEQRVRGDIVARVHVVAECEVMAGEDPWSDNKKVKEQVLKD